MAVSTTVSGDESVVRPGRRRARDAAIRGLACGDFLIAAGSEAVKRLPNRPVSISHRFAAARNRSARNETPAYAMYQRFGGQHR
jgi:hypothetical protein